MIHLTQSIFNQDLIFFTTNLDSFKHCIPNYNIYPSGSFSKIFLEHDLNPYVLHALPPSKLVPFNDIQK